ncbi:MAG TPA: hypothetical protein VFG56_02415 [Candidatus Saccharimonadales bacterium]|nr:hypothetical protein [Candidatus Saccharimonadales bacterium]
MSPEIISSYQRRLDRANRTGSFTEYCYTKANLEVEHAVQAAHQGLIDDKQLEEVAVALRCSQEAAMDDGDVVTLLKSQLMEAFMPLIVYSEALNSHSLKPAEARHVRKNLDMDSAYDYLADIAQDGLTSYDNAKLITNDLAEADPSEIEVREHLKGFLQEITYLMLMTRHHTAKQYAVPALMYKDRLDPVDGRHVDAIYYDNRPTRRLKNCDVQIKSHRELNWYYDYSVVVIDSVDLGNDAYSRLWLDYSGEFTTLRILLNEERQQASRADRHVLDRIHQKVTRKVATV